MLSEFRARVVAGGAEQLALDVLLAALAEKGLVKAGGKQRTDSTHVIGAVRDLNRLELAGESVRAAAEALVAADPDWFTAVFEVPGWSMRYGRHTRQLYERAPVQSGPPYRICLGPSWRRKDLDPRRYRTLL